MAQALELTISTSATANRLLLFVQKNRRYDPDPLVMMVFDPNIHAALAAHALATLA